MNSSEGPGQDTKRALDRVLVLPSWYPTIETPLHGSFVREQALMMEAGFDTKVLFARADTVSRSRALGNKVRRAMGRSAPSRDVTPMMKTPPDGIFFSHETGPSLSEQKTLQESVLHYGEQIERLIQSGWRPDILHAHSVIYGGIIAHELSMRFDIPFIITEHSPIIMNFYSQWLAQRLILAFSSANAVMAVSHYLKRMIKTHHIDCDPIVIGNAIDPNRFEISRPPKPSGPFRILYVTQPVWIKDLPTFFQALQHLKNDGHDDISVTVIVADVEGGLKGGVAQAHAASAGVTEMVDFVEMVDREDMPGYYQQCDLLVSSSLSETFGLSLCEAMACGKPVVTTASGGVSDIVTSDNGIKVPIGDHQALAEGIAQIKTGSRVFDPENVRRSVLERFETRVFVEKLSKQYQEVLQDRRG